MGEEDLMKQQYGLVGDSHGDIKGFQGFQPTDGQSVDVCVGRDAWVVAYLQKSKPVGMVC